MNDAVDATPAATPATLPLTAAQLGLWYAHQLDPDNVVLNIGHYVDLAGSIDVDAYRRAWATTIGEIDGLRATFRQGEGPDSPPRQEIPDTVPWDLVEVDLSDHDDPHAAALRWMDADLRAPRDLGTGPLFALALLTLAPGRVLCYQRIHHIVLDGYGATLAMMRANQLYNAYLAGEDGGDAFTAPLEVLVDDDAAYRGSEQQREDAAYWREVLADDPSPTLLADPPQGLPDRLLRCTREVPAATVATLNDVATSIGVSRSSLLIAAFAAYLHRYTGERDVVLGLPVTARTTDAAKIAPGMVSTIVPLRLDVTPDLSVDDLARQVSERVRALLPHQRFRPEDLRRELGLHRDSRLAGPTINILPIEGGLVFGEHTGTLHNLSVGPVDDMSVIVSRTPDGSGLRVDVDANPDLYDEAQLQGHLTRFLLALDAFAAQTDGVPTAVGEFALASPSDRAVIDEARRGADVAVMRRTTLDFLEAQVRRTPDACALVTADDELTFNDLDRRANRLARHLLDLGVTRGRTVAVALPRRASLVLSLVATHKAGGVYLPIDPEYPAERIAQMLSDARPTCVVTDTATADELPEGDWPLLVVDDHDLVAEVSVRSSAPVTDEERGGPLRPEDPSYVVYTSGSTGRPKGIVVQHRSLVNLFASHASQVFAPARAAVGGRRLRVAHTTAVSFDAAWDPLLWLVDGHELHLVEERVMYDPEALVQFLVDHEIDFVETTPTYMEQLMALGLLSSAGDRVKVVALGGEAVGEELWARLGARDDIAAYNFFGPAEATVDVTTARIAHHAEPVIGRPLQNTRAYVLDAGLQEMPLGAAGELYLAGDGLARSYLDQPGRTAERFVADPFGPTGARMYRTGDVARWRADGTLEFVERVDHQVKIRGFRVELGEVEARLAERQDVRAAAVVVRERDGVQQLVAYVVGDSGSIDRRELRDSVAERLPDYMVPALYVVLDALPLTPNGKLDREALPEPGAEDSARGGGRAAESAQEQLLAGLFAETLGVPEVGVDDDFFELGGHSLLATRLVSRVRSTLGVELPIRALFEAPTVGGLLERVGDAGESRAELRAVERPDELPLSFAQRRLWFLNRMDPRSAAYNIPAVLRLTGALDEEALRAAVHDVVCRHETLRTVFPETDGEPHQVVLDADDVRTPFEVVTTSADALDEALGRVAGRGFDLTVDLPLRVVLHRLSEQEHVLALVVHHIAGDGWSLGPLAADLAAAYGARREQLPPDWTPLPVQYVDYALWQRAVLGDASDEDSAISEQLRYWTGQLADLPTQLELPVDRPRPRVLGDEGGSVPVALSTEVLAGLERIAQAHEVSLFMVLEAGVAALLGRLGGGVDVPIGVPIAGRTDEALDNLVGFFVNTLVLRNDLSGDPTFDEVVDRVRRTALDAYAHQDVPFERIVEEVQPERSLSRHPLFQVMLAFQNNAPVDLGLPGLDVQLDAAAGPAGAKFDLSFDLGRVETDEGPRIAGSVEYSTALFDATTVEDLVVRLERFLTVLVADPTRRVGAVPLLSATEREDALSALDARDRAHGGTTVVAAFEEQARLTPDAVAVRAAGTSLTFADLAEQSARWAAVLVDRGASGRRIGVALPRTPDLVVALLAVLRCGGTYLPLDLGYPADRIAHIVDDAAPAIVLTDRASAAVLPGGVEVLAIDEHRPTPPAADRTLPTVGPRDPAYLTYTSGSTGRPKGVLVEHGSLAVLHAHQRAHLHVPTAERLGRRVRMAHTTAVAFDAAWDPLLWLVSGHELVLVDDVTRRDPEALVALLREEGVDVVETTPTYVEQLLEVGLGQAGLSLVALGGEAVPARLWSSLRALRTDGVEAVNLYGPTEVTVDTLVADLADHEHPVVGGPVDGTAAYVLDAALQPVPVGVVGELYLAGHGLARGYAGRPGLTAERFVADPYGPAGARMYRTGDLARRRRDGALVFVGRVDDQVKVRGFRVELGEIEAVLAEHALVAAAAVDVREDGTGTPQLAAWLVPAGPALEDALDDVRSQAARSLPDHMLPIGWAVVDELPLTPNGKLDRRALPTPTTSAAAGGRAAESDAERALAAVFADLLGVDEVAADVSFFDLGGHSLLATRLVSRIRRELGVELPVRALFEAPTVAELAQRLPTADRARRPLERRERPEVVPLSFAQRRLWFLNRLEESSAAYHIPVAVRLDGDLDVVALRAALGDVVQRHEALRTTLPETDGQPRQQVHPGADIDLEVRDVAEERLDDEVGARVARPFDLTVDRPLRASLLRLADDAHVLLLVLHHVAADGWSMGPLGRDLATAYAARRHREDPRLPALPVQHADHALWQREVLGDADDPGSELARQLAFWTERLAGLPPELDLPTDRPRPARPEREGGEARFTIPADVHRRLAAIARAHDATVFMVLHATLAALLTRLGGGTDVPIGTPVAGRGDEALDELIGFFVNTVVLRADTAGDPTLVELLARVRRADLDAFAHQDLPFERLVEELAPERSLTRHPVFQVMLTLNEEQPAELGLEGLRSQLLPVAAGAAKFDLSFSVEETRSGAEPAGLRGVLEHDGDLRDPARAQQIADRWVRLLTGWLAEPDLPLSAVGLLTDEERTQVLREAGTPDPALTHATVVDAFEATADATPDATALVTGEERLTFAELRTAAHRLAQHLHHRGIGRGDVVGLRVPRSVDAVVGLLGILRSGATYLPLDPTHPAARTASVVAQARPALVLDELPDVPALTDLRALPDLPAVPQPRDAAYVIFTSGSTGEPKGVVVEHAPLAALLAHHRSHLFGDRRRRVAHTTAVTFDASWDPILWMVAGHELHLADDETRTDPEALAAFLAEHAVDVLETTPSYVEELLRHGLGDLALVALGGEAVGDDLWRRLRERGGRAVNLYGPTESTVDAVVAEVADHEHPVIGVPVAGTRALVLDDRLQPVAPGVTGELYLAGAGLARGYLGRPALTAERFVADPYGAPGDRMYRTGDRATWRGDGSLTFEGRVDDQVKIRGFRVELGEVDAVLAACPGVARAASVVDRDASGAGRLVAYLVPATDTGTGADLDVGAVRAAAAERLPDYLLPTAMAVLDELPLTPNGKLDRTALPPADPVGGGGGTAPRTPGERLLAGLFAEVLGAADVGVEDSFFELGGHSLLATRLVARIRAVADVELPVRALFEAPTVAALARRLDGQGGAGGDATATLLPLRQSGSRTPLVCVHPVSGLAWSYAGLAAHLEDRPIWGLQVPGLDGGGIPGDVDALVAAYVAAVREAVPHGPCALLGWSLGGVLAHRIAGRLAAEGRQVEALVLVDSYPGAALPVVDPDDPAAALAAYTEAHGGAAADGEVTGPLAVLDEGERERLVRGIAGVGRALAHAPAPPGIDVPTTIVAAEPDHQGPPLADQWSPLLGTAPVEHPVPHHHFDLMDAAALADVGPLVAAALDHHHREGDDR